MERDGMMKAAIIGSGQIARVSHIPAYKELENVEIVAVCDTNETIAAKLAEDFAIPAYYTNSSRMLSECKPDIVSICVPNKFHYPLVMEALHAGCHVFCEKPPAVSAEEAEQMYWTAEEKKRLLTYDFHFRHGKNVGLAKQKIENGELGDIYYTKAGWLRRRGVPGWGCFTSQELQGGGPLIDIGAHMLDIAFYLLDYPEIEYVCASSSNRIGAVYDNGLMGGWNPAKYTVEDGIFGYIHFTDGTCLQLETSFALNMKERDTRSVRLYGSKSGLSLFPLEIYHGEEMTNENYPFLEETELHTRALHNFVNAARGTEELLVTAEQGVYVQKVIQALYESAQSGKPIWREETEGRV